MKLPCRVWVKLADNQTQQNTAKRESYESCFVSAVRVFKKLYKYNGEVEIYQYPTKEDGRSVATQLQLNLSGETT